MRFISTTRLALTLFLAVAMLVALTASAQQKGAAPGQQKTRAAAQKKNAAVQKTSPARKGEAPGKTPAALDVLPEGLFGFAVVRNLGELDAKLSALAQDLQVPAPGALMMVRTLAGIQEGLDEKGSLVVAVVPGTEEGQPPIPVLFVPVTDYKKFVAQLQPAGKDGGDATEVTIANQSFAVMKKGNYAALAPPDHAESLQKVVAAKGGSLGLPGHMTTWAAGHDAYLVVMPEAIKQGIGPVREGLQQAKAAFPADNDQLQTVAAMFDVYDKILSTIEKEITHFGVGLRLDQGTIYVNSHSAFLPNGSLAQAAGDAQPPAQRALASLSAGPYVMAFDGVIPESWFKGMAKFSAEAMRMMTPPGGEKLSEDQIKKLTEVMQESMSGVESIAFRFGALQPGKSIYAGMSAAMKVKNSKDYLTRYEKSIRAMGVVLKESKNPLFQSYQLTKGKVGGVETLQVTMDMSEMVKGFPDPNMQRMMELMVGEGGKLTAYLAPADATTVVLTYGEDALGDTLKAATKKAASFTAQQEILTTMKLLPKNSQWVAFFSPKGMVEFAQSMMAMIAPGGAVQLAPFPVTPPLGLGAQMTAEGCDTSLVVPKEMLIAIGGYARTMQQNQGGGQLPGVNGVPPNTQKR
ncbi:MAG: hypothetical protein WD894_16365 [Pirellulales bacterium]